MRSRLPAFAASVLLVSLLAGCGGSDDEPSAAPTSSAPAPDSSEAAPDAAASGECVYQETGDAAKDAKLPPAEPVALDAVTITTNFGEIKATLTPDTAPCTVNSFASLAKQGYFDGTKCHRLVPGFVLQCGDPSATGTGGPGYSFADELSGSETYEPGVLAMANSGPDTNGSQFFIMIGDSPLPPDYTVFGKVDAAGLKVAQEIEAAGAGPGDVPVKDVILESVS
jgi:peptidyl-prolyl cis-trans isomerase B (cyclophilin B)